MQRHTMLAEIEVRFVPVPLYETEIEYPIVQIEFSYLRGALPSGPTYDNGGDPGWLPEVGFISAKMIDGKGLNPTDAQLQDWASEYLNSDEGYRLACEVVEWESAISGHFRATAE